MNTPTPTAIYQKLSRMEQEIQRLKIQSYLALPRASRAVSPYADTAIAQALKKTRETIWQKQYAKKIARVR